jgi:hypothetical protein
MPDSDKTPSQEPPKPEPAWKGYVAGGKDSAGHIIDEIHAINDRYVIYFTVSRLGFEVVPSLEQQLGNAEVLVARIIRLLPTPKDAKGKSRAVRRTHGILRLVATALEMIFNGHLAEGLGILSDIRDKLATTADGGLRLCYQAGALGLTLIGWILYLVLHTGYWTICRRHGLPSCPAHAVTIIHFMPKGWDPWFLAAVLGMAGGALSVCLNLSSLNVSLNQRTLFLLAAGATRSVVALIAGAAMLLAMRAKMFGTAAYGTVDPASLTYLIAAEMFFCFLAGFSESLIPNILRDSEKNSGNAAKDAEQARAAEQAKAAKEAEQAKAGSSSSSSPSSFSPSSSSVSSSAAPGQGSSSSSSSSLPGPRASSSSSS